MKFRRQDAMGKPCCPSCGSTSLSIRQKAHCNTCLLSFDLSEAKAVRPPQQKARGSGVIAGRIVHGRCARWGSGLV